MSNPSKNQKRSDYYNDPNHNYLEYWRGREYENLSEEIAIRRLLKDKHFRKAVDIGGGYGRLSTVLAEYADKVILAEPSKQQIDLAKKYLNDKPNIIPTLVSADNLGLEDSSVDLANMVRVMHHLPDPSAEFREIARVLADDGLFILEVANYTHFQNRLKHIAQMKRFADEPVDIRSKGNRNEDTIPFVNHNPKTVIKQLSHAGLKVVKTLSVSNLRSPSLKKILPRPLMLKIEFVVQPMLAKTYFGPSTFFLVKKAK